MTEYNKVIYDGNTLIDLTQDDVTESDVLAGVYFHKADGTRSVGTLNVIDMFYPVGSYYETSDSTFNPNTTWGGTWVLETEGQVHVSAGENYEVGDAGGSKYMQAHTHDFTQPKTPSHSHTLYYRKASATSGNSWIVGTSTNNDGTTTVTGGSGVSCTGGSVGAVSGATTGNADNMPPYIVVNRWHRTA